MKTLSKKTGFFALVCAAYLAVFAGSAVAQKAPPASPAAKDSIAINGKLISVKYSAPSVKGRDIFGATGLVSKDKTYPVWRAGANSATAFHTDADLNINGLDVPKGDYTLYVSLADPKNWELVVNKQTGQWGTVYKPEMDLGRAKMTTKKTDAPAELLVYKFTPSGKNKATLTLSWENYTASIPVTVK